MALFHDSNEGKDAFVRHTPFNGCSFMNLPVNELPQMVECDCLTVGLPGK